VIPDPDADDRRRLPLTFDRAAEDYDRTRPVCPPALFDDLVELAGLAPGGRVLEVGPGTGQASVPLAERGLAVTAVEPGAALAAIARRRLAGFPDATVVTSAFEAWEPEGGRPFDAVVACNSLHWVDPAVRYARPAGLLRDGGHLVVAGSKWATAPDAERFWADVQEDYRAVGFAGGPPPPPEAIQPWHLPPGAGAFFSEIAARSYPFGRVYTAEEYLANLGTQTGPAQLGEERRAEFLARVERRLAGWPHVTAAFVALLTVGRRHSGM
jgi:SAM-dependent methyltransferase